jgi:hypothetical protein
MKLPRIVIRILIVADKTVKETFYGIVNLIPVADKYPKGAIFILVVLMTLYWPFLWVFGRKPLKGSEENLPGLNKVEESPDGQVWQFHSDK